MLKEKRGKGKDGSESKNKSGGSSGTQNTTSGEATSGSVKEEKSDLDGSSTTIKKETDGRKSTTPVKSELVTTPNGGGGGGGSSSSSGGGGSDNKKDTAEQIAIKSEVKQEEGSSSTLDSGNVQVKEELNESDGFGQSTNVPSSTAAQQQQQQQQQQTSNVNKQSNNAEYMQQHSQIFVFSTALANKGAEAVLSGQFKSIIAYHCAQPGTKKILEKHPLKTAQFNRQNPNQFMASMAKKGPMMRGNGNLAGNPTFKTQQQQSMNISNNQQMQQSTANFLNPSMEDILNGTGADDISAWEQQAGSLGLDALTQNGDASGNFLGDAPNLDADSFLGNNDVSALGDGSLTGSSNDTGGGGGGGVNPISPGFGHPKLQGVKVPDENLTPQQRQHREEQLATLRRMKNLFFPEHPGPPSDCQMNQMNDNCMKMAAAGNQMGNQMGGMGPNMNSAMDMMPNCNMGGPMRGPPMGMGGGGGSGNPMFRPMGPGHHGHHGHSMSHGHGMNDPLGMDGMSGGMSGCQMPMDNSPGMTGHMSGGMMMPNKPGAGCGGMPDWNRLPPHHHPGLVDGKMPQNMGPNFKKLGGPPPPYQQTTRSASVPIATQSPNPSSPNNPTSNLSLPSPRAYNSNMSPADASRMPPQMPMKSLNPHPPGQSPSHDSTTMNAMNAAAALHRSLSQSNPSTPLSAHLSPSTSLKDTDNTGNNEGKEPNLMPVPSPQQIQYLNNFEGQELTIQKQPNAGIKESPPGSAEKKPPSSGGGATSSYPNTPSNPGSNQNLSNLSSTNFPVPSSPSTTPSQATPNAANSNDSKTNNKPMMGSSPQQQQQQQQQVLRQGSVTDSGSQQIGPGADQLFSSNSPNYPGQQQQQQQQVPSMQGNMNQQKPPGNFPNDHNCPPTPQFPPCSRSDNVPLNPSSIPPANKVSHFDPISSLAQMSQQLTSSVSMGGSPGMNPQSAMMSGAGGGFNMGGNNGPADIGGMGPMVDMGGMGNPGMDCSGGMGGPHAPGGMNQFNNMGPMGPRSMSPKLGGQMPPFPGGQPGMPRMMRPQMSSGGGMYNGANVQVKASAPNTIQYLPTRPQMGAPPSQRGPPSLEFLNRFAGPMHNMPPDARMQNMQYFQQQQNFNQGMDDMVGDMIGPMPGNPMMGVGQGMMRPRPPMRMPMGAGGGPPFNAPPNSNPFGPKMGMEGQPLPPSGPPMGPGPMGPAGFNKFGGGGGGNSNADPNYAQQYHNFQQQLYATNTRGQLGQQSFFGPK